MSDAEPRPGARLGALKDRLYRVVLPGSTGLHILAVLVGSISGLLSVLFWHAINLVHSVGDVEALTWVQQRLGASWMPGRLWIALFPAVGALLMGVLTLRIARTPSNPGVPTMMLDARIKPGSIPLRYLPMTFVAAALIIGSGGSAGREAPVVAMGGIIGGRLGRWLGLSPRRRQILIGCGTGAAIAAAFNAPLAGVFFALELVLGDYTAGTMSPVVLASVAGTVVCRALEGVGASHFRVPPYHIGSWLEIVLYVGLGLAAGLVGPLFARTERALHSLFSSSSLPPVLRPAVGGLAVGAIALVLPQVMGNGYDHVEVALRGDMVLTVLVALVFGKVLATSLTLGSGGWGGDFAPLLFIGAMLGGAYGAGLDYLLPNHGLSSGAYAMVGMGALLTATLRCPVTAILLLFELTGSYQVILPIMTSCAVAIPVSRILLRRGMYHAKLEEMGGPAGEHPETRLLAGVKVATVMRPQAVTLAAAAPYREILRVIATSDQLVFPVLGDGGRLLGALTFHDLRGYLDAVELADLVVAVDVASEEVPVLTLSDSLEHALQLFAAEDIEELPVVEDLKRNQFAGILTRRQALAARARLLAEWEMEDR